MPRHAKSAVTAAASLAPSPHNLFAGTSGWAYPTWKPGFYPTDVPPRAFLHYYAARLTSVEVNYTFRTLPTPEQLHGWLDATPPGFRFAFKAPQRITHFQRLKDTAETLAEFLASIAPAGNAGKLGPLLFQLPPNFAANTELLGTFLGSRAFKKHAPRIAFEFRHASWFTNATYDTLRAHNAALCIAEGDELVTPEVHTGDFFCFRLRRSGGYKPAKLKSFAEHFSSLAKQGNVFAYFRHEDEPTGALNAIGMLKYATKFSRANEKAAG